MTAQKDKSGAGTGSTNTEKPADAPDSASTRKTSSAQAEIPPTLAGYFGKARVSPAAFFKVLRQNKDKVKSFPPEDQKAAAELMPINDPEAERLWGLMAQASLPDPVKAWIWGAAEARLAEELKKTFEPRDHPNHIFESVLRKLSADLNSKNKEDKGKKKRAENLLRLAICWLVEKRSLKPWDAAEQLGPVLFKDLNAAGRSAQRAVQKGKSGDLRIAAAMAALGGRMVKNAKDEQVRLLHRFNDERRKNEKLCRDLEAAKKTISDQETGIARLEQTLADERLHMGHDLTELRAGQKVLLEQLRPLLADAVDALEIEPPAPGTALRRVKAALSAIEKARG